MSKRDIRQMKAMVMSATTPEYRRQLEMERAILVRCGFQRDELMLLIDPQPGRMEDRFQYMPRKVASVWP